VQVKSREELKKAAKDLKYPLVLKVDAEEVVHKSDAGGVTLNLEDETSLLAEFDRMAAAFKQYKPAFVVQEQMTEGKEVIMGAKASEGIGPMLMFGLGGVFVETLKDVQFRLAPLTADDASSMIESIKGYPILQGTRGEKPADTDKLVEMLVRLSQLTSDFPEIDEMDLNPVFVFEKGKGAGVVDARLKVRNTG
jgi:acyl-CoA synthetase (NDP forming)